MFSVQAMFNDIIYDIYVIAMIFDDESRSKIEDILYRLF